MAFNFRSISAICTILFLFLVNGVTSIPTGEFDSMLDTLRVRGYELFCNAIVTSDLQFDLLYYQNEDNSNTSFHSFTFFAPPDSSLFALDMTQPASSYTDTLRLHVVPRRLSIAELRRFPAGYSIPTLLPERYLNVTRSPGSGYIAVAGVDIAFPGLFYGRNVAVHGLAGILSLRAYPRVVSGSPPAVRPVRSSDHWSFSPRTGLNSLANHTVLPPSARPIVSPPSVGIFPPAIHSPEGSPVYQTVHSPSAGPTAADSNFSAGSLLIHGGSPASSTESPASESPEYLHSAISAPPIGYSESAAPSPLSSDALLPKSDRVSLMETFTGGSEGFIEAVTIAGEEQETKAEMKDVSENSEPLDGIRNCVTRDVGLGLEHSFTRDRAQYMQCRSTV